MNTSNINPVELFSPFKTAIGKAYDKVCADTKSQLGRWDKDIVSKGGNWKRGAKGSITNKEGHKLQLPLNNPMATLILFALDIHEIAERADFGGNATNGKYDASQTGVVAELPKVCIAWIAEQNAELSKQPAVK